MSIYCSFTVVRDVFADSFQLFTEWATFPRGTVILKSSLLHVYKSVEQRWCWLWDSVGKLSRSRKIQRKADQTAFFCPSCCQDAVLLAGQAARMWKQQITINMKLFFTLYILSIFTHKMYMIGMHIIFLLTDSFNKALCQSATTVSTFCFFANLSPQLKSENI